jgi:hypothetical protein
VAALGEGVADGEWGVENGTRLLVLFGAALFKSPNWYLRDALSEEAGEPLPAGQKPVLVASNSRLIALLGLTAIHCL